MIETGLKGGGGTDWRFGESLPPALPFLHVNTGWGCVALDPRRVQIAEAAPLDPAKEVVKDPTFLADPQDHEKKA